MIREKTHASLLEMKTLKLVRKERHVLNLDRKQCDCKEWDLTGIPCRHAIACIREMRRDVQSYVHEWFHAEEYKLAYGGIIYPFPDSSTWEKVECLTVLPPPEKKQSRRRKQARKRREDEPKNKNCISKVGQVLNVQIATYCKNL